MIFFRERVRENDYVHELGEAEIEGERILSRLHAQSGAPGRAQSHDLEITT